MKTFSKEFEETIDGITYDNGYGDQDAELLCGVLVTVSLEDNTSLLMTKDAISSMGSFMPKKLIFTAEVKDGQFSLYDHDGGIFAEAPYEDDTFNETLKSMAIDSMKEYMAKQFMENLNM